MKASDHSSAEVLVLILAITAGLLVFGWHCPIYAFIHLPCPGCGMTRALISLLHGDLQQSLSWHVMLIPTIILASAGLVFHRRQKVIHRLVWLWLLLMGAAWLWRLYSLFVLNIPWDFS